MKFAKASIAGGLLVWGQTVWAEPIYYDCDAPGGSFSKIESVQNHADYRVRGSITPYQMRRTAAWLPAANVRIEGQSNGAGITLVHSEEETFVLSITLLEEGQRREIHLPIEVKLNQKIDFEIASSEGQGYVSISGKLPFEFDIGADAKIVVSCSSGGFKFEQLDWASPATP